MTTEYLLRLSDNGAVDQARISGNGIGAEQEGGLQRICVAGGIELAATR
jgi:hypothetical protein